VCPMWPGQPMTAHWGVPDPAAVQGSDAARRRAFKDAAIALKRRVDLTMALPIPTLAKLALQQAIKGIGKN
jgi:arsenate reductase